MKVKELMEVLRNFPPNLDVIIKEDEDNHEMVIQVYGEDGGIRSRRQLRAGRDDGTGRLVTTIPDAGPPPSMGGERGNMGRRHRYG